MAKKQVEEEQSLSKTIIFKMLVLLSSSVIIFLTLFSYDPLDPSFNRVADNAVQNWFGRFGAFLADPYLQIFGVAGFLLPVFLIIWSYRTYQEGYISRKWLKFPLLIISMLAFDAITAVFEQPESWPFYVGMGGVVGDIFKSNLVELLTIYGYVSSFALIFLASFYFASAIKTSEVITAAYAVYNGSIVVYNGVLTAYEYISGLLSRFKKEDAELDDAQEESDEEEVIDEEEEELIEEPKPKKKKNVSQKSLKLPMPDGEFELPDLDLLSEVPAESSKKTVSQKSLENNAKLLESVLKDFGIKGEILKVKPGPVVTLYELEPSPGTKSSRVIGLADDIARSMSSVSARISTIPGRNVLGIELPNTNRETVYLRELLETEEYQDERIKLPMALGKDISGEPIMTDLSRMPHLLVAGTTGSGKSVSVNAMILSLLYRLTPEECKFIMIDPKMLELSIYDDIPHLIAPVVTEPAKAVTALRWAVKEMENRYRAMSQMGVRNIAGYNKKIEEAVEKGEVLERVVQTGFDEETGEPMFEKQPLAMNKLPFIVIIVDEMADLMLTAGKDIESLIQRLAQMARAAGIHMIMATQRPSVDVITGVIKANFPTRISFQVTSRIDSRTIIGEMGAEQLLGMGDMLYMSGGRRLLRVHGPFVDDKEVEDVVNHLKSQGSPNYVEDVTREDESFEMGEVSEGGGDLYSQAVAIVKRDNKASTSYLQRQLRIGYNRAADLIDKMEAEGIISAPNHAGKREVLETV